MNLHDQIKPVVLDVSFSEQILAIFNDAILNSTALYDYKPRTMTAMHGWFELKAKGRYPVIGFVAPDGELMGFGSYGIFRAFPAYKYTVEHSLYVAAKYRGQGIGEKLLREIIASAGRQDYHALIGCIDSQNAASIALHAKLGFRRAGTLPQVGFKFGLWLDLELYELLLATPAAPQDG